MQKLDLIPLYLKYIVKTISYVKMMAAELLIPYLFFRETDPGFREFGKRKRLLPEKIAMVFGMVL